MAQAWDWLPDWVLEDYFRWRLEKARRLRELPRVEVEHFVGDEANLVDLNRQPINTGNSISDAILQWVLEWFDTTDWVRFLPVRLVNYGGPSVSVGIGVHVIGCVMVDDTEIIINWSVSIPNLATTRRVELCVPDLFERLEQHLWEMVRHLFGA